MPKIEFDGPVLILDEVKARQNIASMAKKAKNSNVAFRPHFKTHQSIKIGEWFREEGVSGITVSSVTMAEYFAKNGWESITIAFPVSHLQADRLSKLASTVELRILVVDIDSVLKLDMLLSSRLQVYIELDPGYNRSGIPISAYDKLNDLKQTIVQSKNLEFYGFYTHAGHSYKCRSESEILELTSPITSELKLFKNEFKEPICFGDTPSCSILDSFSFTDEISPGNFIFYDWTQVEIGACLPQHIAVSMKCPVVAKYPERHELLIHGGAIHFSKDSFTNANGFTHFGRVIEESSSTVQEGNYIKSLSQEHGIIQCTEEFFNSIEVGDFVSVLPIHSCLTAESMGNYYTETGEEFDHMSKKLFS